MLGFIGIADVATDTAWLVFVIGMGLVAFVAFTEKP
jgi:uncharacterized membrane protein YtjA (UPF0391 family)